MREHWVCAFIFTNLLKTVTQFPHLQQMDNNHTQFQKEVIMTKMKPMHTKHIAENLIDYALKI